MDQGAQSVGIAGFEGGMIGQGDNAVQRIEGWIAGLQGKPLVDHEGLGVPALEEVVQRPVEGRAAGALAWIAVLARLDLSVAYPFLALNFVLVTLSGRFLLGPWCRNDADPLPPNPPTTLSSSESLNRVARDARDALPGLERLLIEQRPTQCQNRIKFSLEHFDDESMELY